MIKKEKVWENAIANRKTKEMLCDTALSVLLNMHYMTLADMPSGVRLSDDRPGWNDWSDV